MDEKVTVQDQLDELLESKLNMKTAINNNGGEVTDETTFREYPEQIQEVIDKNIVPYSDLEDTVELAMNVNGFKPIEVELMDKKGVSGSGALCIEIINYNLVKTENDIICKFRGFQPYYRNSIGIASGVDYSMYNSQTAVPSKDGYCLFCPIFEITNPHSENKGVRLKVIFSNSKNSAEVVNYNITIEANSTARIKWAAYADGIFNGLKYTKNNDLYYFDSTLENEIKNRLSQYLNIDFTVTIL